MPSTPLADDTRDDLRDDLEAIERALTTIFRWVNLPKVREHLAARSGVTLERAAYGMLAQLHDLGAQRLSELAARVGVDTSTASRQVCRLESEGLVARRDDPRDKRASMLSVSPRGRAALNKVRRARREMFATLLNEWSEDERRQLARLLGRLANDLRALAKGEL